MKIDWTGISRLENGQRIVYDVDCNALASRYCCYDNQRCVDCDDDSRDGYRIVRRTADRYEIEPYGVGCVDRVVIQRLDSGIDNWNISLRINSLDIAADDVRSFALYLEIVDSFVSYLRKLPQL